MAVGDPTAPDVNNRPLSQPSTQSDTILQLEHAARIITEGDDRVSVPKGYGIAPFLQLPAFLDLLFELCGYTVTANCFSTNDDLKDLILLHNVSDVICAGRIDFSDLVPNCTVAEILDWLLQKFHAQIVVHPASKTVEILLLEDILAADYDADLTGRLLGDIANSFSRSSRVILRPNTSLEGAAPAAETLEDLKTKYGTVTELPERAGYVSWQAG